MPDPGDPTMNEEVTFSKQVGVEWRDRQNTGLPMSPDDPGPM